MKTTHFSFSGYNLKHDLHCWSFGSNLVAGSSVPGNGTNRVSVLLKTGLRLFPHEPDGLDITSILSARSTVCAHSGFTVQCVQINLLPPENNSSSGTYCKLITVRAAAAVVVPIEVKQRHADVKWLRYELESFLTGLIFF